VTEDEAGIVVEDDVVSESLFQTINSPDTTINILIGAKKFMEGWNSWRVSNMGLLNIGRSEGSEIIQLFGRGVRLRGLGFSLKRSAALDGEHPEHIKLLETLNIFAVRANYMAQFREYLEREGVPTLGQVELPLAIRPNKVFLGKGLLVPRVPEDRCFAQECDILLLPDKAAKVAVDVSLKVEIDAHYLRRRRHRSNEIRPAADYPAGKPRPDRLGSGLYRPAGIQGRKAICQPGHPAGRAQSNRSRDRTAPLCVDRRPKRRLCRSPFEDVAILRETVLSILRKYVEKYYRVCQERWESDHMVYGTLTTQDPQLPGLHVSVARTEVALIAAIKKLIGRGHPHLHR